MRISLWWQLCLVLALGSGAALLAQEPGYLGGIQAERFPQGAGHYNYVVPCEAKAHPQAAYLGPADALCWLVAAKPLAGPNGPVPEVTEQPGLLKIAADAAAFLPNAPGIAAANFVPSTVEFIHQPGQAGFVLRDGSSAYAIRLISVCFTCDPSGKSSLNSFTSNGSEPEFALVHDALKDFASTMARVRAVASLYRIGVSPGHQPSAQASAAIAQSYANIYDSLAGECPDAAKACVKSYAGHAACIASGRLDCDAAPTCRAQCVVPATRLNDLMRNTKAAIAFPAWEEDAGYLTPQSASPVMGVIGMQGLNQPAKTPKDIKIMVAPSAGVTHISGGVVEGMRTSYVAPQYPPVAKAAHVGGVVHLRCIISRTGDVRELFVIDGPALLQGAAMDAVKQWKYKPYILNGEPVEVESTIAVNFNFNSGGETPAAGAPPSAPGATPPSH